MEVNETKSNKMNSTKYAVSFLSKYIHQLETNLQNFVIPSLVDVQPPAHEEEEKEETIDEENEIESIQKQQPTCPDFAPYQSSRPICEPCVCLWYFMEKDELEDYLSLNSKRKMKKVLEDKIGIKPKGFPRMILTDYMIDVTIFCKNSKFNIQQSGAVLGMYYLTHKYFTDHLYICPEDVLNYFKQFLIHHSILFPPTHIKLFTIEECRGIVLHFGKLYLRHMPLIRLLTLPNFGFKLVYELEPEPKPVKPGKKDKKAGGDKKDKKKKK